MFAFCISLMEKNIIEGLHRALHKMLTTILSSYKAPFAVIPTSPKRKW